MFSLVQEGRLGFRSIRALVSNVNKATFLWAILFVVIGGIVFRGGAPLLVIGSLLLLNIVFMLLYPSWGLFLVVFVTFAFPWEVFEGILALGTLPRMVGLLFASTFLLRVLMTKGKIRWPVVNILPFVLFLSWRLFEILRTNAPAAAVWIRDPGSISEFILRLIMYTGLYLLILNVCKTVREINVVPLAIVLGVLLSCAYSFFIYFGLASPFLESEYMFLRGGRISGLRGNPGETSTLTVIAIGLILPFVLHRSRFLKGGTALLARLFTRRWVIYIVLTIFLLGLLLSGQRTGIITLGSLLTILFLTRGLHLWRVVLVLGLVAFLVLVVTPIDSRAVTHLIQIPFLYDLFYGESVFEVDSSAAGRYERMMIAVEIFRERPLIGIGFGNYELKMAESIGYGSSAHNLYAEILGEEGIIGLAIYFYLIFSIGRTLLHSQRSLAAQGEMFLCLLCQGFLLSFIAFSVDRFFGNGDQLNKLVILYLGMAAVFAHFVRYSARKATIHLTQLHGVELWRPAGATLSSTPGTVEH